MRKQTARRPLTFISLHDSVDEIHELSRTGFDQIGNWDLSKICQHLNKTLRMSMEGAPFNLPFFLKPIARWILFETVMAGKPTRLPLKTVRQFLPSDSTDVEKDISDYESLVGQVLADSTVLLSDHPVFGRVTKDQWRKFHAWHAAHHLSYLIPITTPDPVLSSS